MLHGSDNARAHAHTRASANARARSRARAHYRPYPAPAPTRACAREPVRLCGRIFLEIPNDFCGFSYDVPVLWLYYSPAVLIGRNLSAEQSSIFRKKTMLRSRFAEKANEHVKIPGEK